MKTFIIILLTTSIVACVPATIDGLRKDYAARYSFHVNENYQSVYRKTLNSARKCHQYGGIARQMIVQGDLYTDIERGNITVASYGGFGVANYLTIDISKLNNGNTKVVVFNAVSMWKSNANAVRGWIKNNSSKCKSYD